MTDRQFLVKLLKFLSYFIPPVKFRVSNHLIPPICSRAYANTSATTIFLNCVFYIVNKTSIFPYFKFESVRVSEIQ